MAIANVISSNRRSITITGISVAISARWILRFSVVFFFFLKKLITFKFSVINMSLYVCKTNFSNNFKVIYLATEKIR